MAAPQSATPTSTPADGSSSSSSTVPNSAIASIGRNATDGSKAGNNITQEEKDRYQQYLLDQSVTRDWLHYASLHEGQARTEKTIKSQYQKVQEFKIVQSAVDRDQRVFSRSRLYGEGYNGYGNGHTDSLGETRVIYPNEKPRLGKRTAHSFKCSRKDLREQAEQPEELVPIRLDVDWDKIKLRDTFTWNLHDRVIAVEVFAAQLVEDMGIKPPAAQPVYDQIVAQIKYQLNDFYPFAFSAEEALDPELPYSAYKNDEMRILIKLNITIGAHTLVDQFEWDINNEHNDPEKFAAVMADELSLAGEFKTAIAHCIREQAQLFSKSLYTVGHPFDGRPVEDPDLVQAMLPSPLPSVFRPQQQAKEYGPFLYELNDAELERNEVIFSREQRRQKRSVNRRGGPVLPDLKERQRTIRTLILSSVLPGAANNVEDSRLYKRTAGVMRRNRVHLRDGEISESEDSDDSMPDSPAPSQFQGTTRTRGMRGAASAAQQRMAHLGRSETPEIGIAHHHETRISRRHGREREETEEPQHLIVTLKVSHDKLRRLMRDAGGRKAASQSETTASQLHMLPVTSASAGHMGPPSTLGLSAATSLPTLTSGTPHPPVIHNHGRLPAPPPGPQGQPTPPPVCFLLPLPDILT